MKKGLSIAERAALYAAIRAEHTAGASVAAIARKHEITEGGIRNILNRGRDWQVIRAHRAEEIQAARQSGETLAAIGARYGVSKQAIGATLKRHGYGISEARKAAFKERDAIIAREFAKGVRNKDLTARFGLSSARISQIVAKETGRVVILRRGRPRVPTDTIDRMRLLWDAGLTGQQIADDLGTTRSAALALARRNGFSSRRPVA